MLHGLKLCMAVQALRRLLRSHLPDVAGNGQVRSCFAKAACTCIVAYLRTASLYVCCHRVFCISSSSSPRMHALCRWRWLCIAGVVPAHLVCGLFVRRAGSSSKSSSMWILGYSCSDARISPSLFQDYDCFSRSGRRLEMQPARVQSRFLDSCFQVKLYGCTFTGDC